MSARSPPSACTAGRMRSINAVRASSRDARSSSVMVSGTSGSTIMTPVCIPLSALAEFGLMPIGKNVREAVADATRERSRSLLEKGHDSFAGIGGLAAVEDAPRVDPVRVHGVIRAQNSPEHPAG